MKHHKIKPPNRFQHVREYLYPATQRELIQSYLESISNNRARLLQFAQQPRASYLGDHHILWIERINDPRGPAYDMVSIELLYVGNTHRQREDSAIKPEGGIWMGTVLNIVADQATPQNAYSQAELTPYHRLFRDIPYEPFLIPLWRETELTYAIACAVNNLPASTNNYERE